MKPLADHFTPDELQTLLRYASDALEAAGENGDLDDAPDDDNALIERLVMLARAN